MVKKNSLGVILVGLFALAVADSAPAHQGGSVARWDFDVYLNDKRVGTHLYEVTSADGIQKVQSEANFNYKILFISAYRYEHSNTEQWADNCLLDIRAQTNANGEQLAVSGEQMDSVFAIDNGQSARELPECVMTFAYWNPDFLQQSQLLNPQTGEYVDVSVERLDEELLEVRGQQVTATPFRLTAYEVDLTLWYSDDDRWLALESVAEGGHIIRYELS